MIEDYQKVIDQISTMKNVRLFGMFKMDDVTDRWTILFGVVGVKDLDARKKFFDKVFKIMSDDLSKDLLGDIARVGVFPTQTSLIKDLLKYTPGSQISTTKANGNFIHDGYVFISRKASNDVKETIQTTN